MASSVYTKAERSIKPARRVRRTLWSVVILLALNDDEISKLSSNIVLAVSEKIFPKPWSYMAVIAVMLSTIQIEIPSGPWGANPFKVFVASCMFCVCEPSSA